MQSILSFIKGHYKPIVSVCLFMALVVFLLLYASSPQSVTIRAEYDEQSHTLHVWQEVNYQNNTGLELDNLVFHLYANAFSSASKAPVPKADFVKAYPNGFSEGGVEMHEVFVEDAPSGFSIEGEQDTLLYIPLEEKLKDNRGVKVTLRYSVQLPETRLRTGYSQRDVRLSNVFAVPAYFSQDGFMLNGYAKIGDPFVSDVADYDVTIVAPTSYVVAAPGQLGDGEDGVWRFSIKDAREFCAVLSKDFAVCITNEGGTQVKAFADTKESADLLAGYGAKALKTFNSLFGQYPYDDYLVVSADFYLGGMEYPAMVIIDDKMVERNDAMLEFVVAHETAHQWWYAAVGSDQINHPWQDEALTEYSTLLYYEANYGQEAFVSLYNSMIRPVVESSALKGQCMDVSIDAFETSAYYDALIYRKGAAMWHDIRVLLGNDKFLNALSSYYRANCFKVAQPHDLLSTLGGQGSARAMEWIGGEKLSFFAQLN